MRIWKVFLVIILIIAGLFLSLRLATVQDLIFKALVTNLANFESSFPAEDSLSAIVCGSRSPLVSPGRAQTCIAVQAGSNIFIVDIGDGSANNIQAFNIPTDKIKAVLITHLHSDHISDLADLHLLSWVQGRNSKLKVFGPEGIDLVTSGFELAYEKDYQFRTEHHGDEMLPKAIAGFDTTTIDLNNAVIFDKNGLKITAFKVTHEPIDPALGFRFDYKGRSIVISGDTSYDENLAKAAKDADVMFAEAQANHMLNVMKESVDGPLEKILDDIQTYHMTPVEAARLAKMARVDHVIFYHLNPAPRIGIMEDIFTRGVDEIIEDWTMSKDGTMVVLPIESNEIKVSELK